MRTSSEHTDGDHRPRARHLHDNRCVGPTTRGEIDRRCDDARHNVDADATDGVVASVHRTVAATWPPPRWADVPVLVAISGGADSVAMLRALLTIDVADADRFSQTPRFVVAHYNHRRRGEASEGDQRFVADLADAVGLPFEHHRETDLDIADEATMRERRRAFLVDVARRYGCRYVATAHHRNDHVETVLHHLFRGSGLAGLSGIDAFGQWPSDLVVARPMRELAASVLRQYLSSIGQDFRIDASNDDTRYTRNWLRHELLPMIRSRFPGADEAIVNAARAIRQSHQALDQSAERLIDEHVRYADDVVQIEVMDWPPAVAAVAIAKMWDHSGWPRRNLNRDAIENLTALIRGDSHAAMVLPGAVRADRIGRTVRLQRQRD